MEEYRNYRILTAPFSMFKILNLGKGAIPAKLSGSYTTPKEAKVAIDQYLDTKGVKDGSSDSGS